MNPLIEKRIHCPYCGEPLTILIDDSIPHQNYIEDCQVCCRPITFDVTLGPLGEVSLSASHENE